jgi:DNA polymerase-3 subunit alpha
MTSTAQVGQLPDGQATRMGGIISKLVPKTTKAGKPMAIMALEDLDGTVEVLVFPECYARSLPYLKTDAAVFVCGTANRKEDPPKIFAEQIIPLDEVPKKFTKAVHIRLPAETTTPAVLEQLQGVLRAHKGRVPVIFCFMYANGHLVFLETGEPFWINPNEEFTQAVEAIAGEDTVWLKVDADKLNTTTNSTTRPSWGGDRKPKSSYKPMQWDSNRPE